MNWLKSNFAFVTLLVFYLVLFVPFIGQVHLFDWDEINFAEAAREMILTGDWVNVQINFEPFWEKPPLFIWLQAISMKVFGVNEFAARFPNVVVGFITLFVLYFFVIRRYGKQAAIFSILLYIGSLTPHFYFKSGIIDPLFNLLIFGSVLYLIKSVEKNENSSFFFSGICLGFAVLTKGPVALLIVGLTGLFYQIIYKNNFYKIQNILSLIGGVFIPLVVVFGVQVYENGFWFLKEFLVYQIDLFRYPIASHGQPFYYHVVVLLVGCFPLFILALRRMISRQRIQGDATMHRWMKVLFWVVLILFSSVTTKIVHYSSMCYLPLAVVGGVWLSGFQKMYLLERVFLSLIGMIWVSILLIAGWIGVNRDGVLHYLRNNIGDEFTLAQLQTDVSWSIVPLVLASVLFGVLISMILKPSKVSITRFLTTNTLVIALLMSTVISSVESTVQGSWIDHLTSYQDKEMAHFTFGFKSYAHRYYTKQKSFSELDQAKQVCIKRQNIESMYDLDQNEKKYFDNALRDLIIRETDLPVSVSCKIQKFESIQQIYPELKLVFEGNGYGVWERL
ncbi:MAG: ArnT family glycosyltransferase [Bacteroidia bacterium]